MISQLLTRKNLLFLGLIALLLFALPGTLLYFMPVNAVQIAADISLFVAFTAIILYFAKQDAVPRPKAVISLLAIYLVWYVLCCLSMTSVYNNDWVNYNSEPLLDTVVLFFVAFPIGAAIIHEKKLKIGWILLHSILLIWTVFIAVVLLYVFRGQSIPTASGGLIRMYRNALYLNCYYNTTGVFEMVFLLACCCMAVKESHIAVRIAYCFGALIHWIALALSNSRTSYYAALAGFAGIAGVGVYLLLKKRPLKTRRIGALIACILAAAAFYVLRSPIFSLYSTSVNAAAQSNGADQQTAAAARELFDSTTATLTGRTTLWKATLQSSFSSFRMFFFGVTPPSVPSMVSQATNGRFNNMYTHNQILEVAASTGIPGMCLMGAWFILILRDTYLLIFVKKDRSAFLCVPIFILALFLANMAEATLMYYGFLSSYVFFILCGLLHGKVHGPIRESFVSFQKKARKKRI